MFENLKITCYPACGIVTDETLPIDAIVYFAAMREKYGWRDADKPGVKTGGNALRVGMPFKVHQAGSSKWFYAASFAQWSEPVAESTDYWNKRFDSAQSELVNFASKRGKVLIEQGRYKAYHMPVFIRHALEVCWYVVADGDALARLLPFMTHVGKKTSQGWGEVLKWSIEPWHADWSIFDDSGRLMRAIPADGQPGDMLYCGYRPSYWLPCNQAMCRVS
jgi:CRISPR type IV-associated protein Csf3